jgi:DNA helicase HerA-like ATPase
VHLLDGVDMYRLTCLPRPPDRVMADPTPNQLVASLTAAHATMLADPAGDSAAFVVAWIRTPRDGLHVLVGGRPILPCVDQKVEKIAASVPVLYPPGARGIRLAAGDGAGLLREFGSWVPCLGQPDSLRVTPGSGERWSAPRRGSFDDYAAHLGHPFAWVAYAEPLPRAVTEAELGSLRARIPRLRQRTNSESDRIDLVRAEERYRELSRALAGGMWNLRILVGGADPGVAHAVAALLCGATDLDQRPYALSPGEPTNTLTAAAYSAPTTRSEDRPTSPFAASVDLLAAVARPPSQELPGIRLIDPHCFDVTADPVDGSGVRLGVVLDRAYASAGDLMVSRQTLNRHTFICGATGSGKSQTMRSLLESLARDPEPVPWLVIEPAKAEYAGMAGRLIGHAPVTVIRPGDPELAPASLNPLEPEPGYPLQSHADLLRALFLAAFEADEPFPQILSRALTKVYTLAGWDMISSRPRPMIKPKLHLDEPDQAVSPIYPTLGQLQATARSVVDKIGYGPEITANVRGFVDVRIGSLRDGTPGRFFEGGHPLDIDSLLTSNVVLELDAITNDQDKAFLMGAVLIRIVEHLRVHQQSKASGSLQHVLVLEEAHRLLKKATIGPAAAAVELFASLLAEIRAYGEGVVVVEQIPTKILPDVLKNTALKIMHRLPARDDREAVGGTINLRPEQSELVVSLPAGRAAVATDGMDRPLLVEFPLREHAESVTEANLRPPICATRSRLCGRDCQANPCSLRALGDASALANRPDLIVWIEAVAVAHIIGQPPPGPAPTLREELNTLPRRQRQCALSHEVERATAARSARLHNWVDIADFAAQLYDVARAKLDDQVLHAEDRLRWTAECYRWQEVLFALEDAVAENGEDSPPHDSTARWAKQGLKLYGTDLGSQLAELRAHPNFRAGAERVCVGDVDASQLARAIDDLTGSTGPEALDAALQLSCAGNNLHQIASQINDLIWVRSEGV